MKLSYLKFERDLQNTQTQAQTQILKYSNKLKTQTRTQTFEYFCVHMSNYCKQHIIGKAAIKKKIYQNQKTNHL